MELTPLTPEQFNEAEYRSFHLQLLREILEAINRVESAIGSLEKLTDTRTR